jgi:thiol-disulfide isomerase/thioredoxin
MKPTTGRAVYAALTVALLLLPAISRPWLRPATAALSRGAPARAKLTALDAAALRQKLAALRGKIVVLNMWATWCGPCVMEFPELVKFSRAYRDRGVTVIGLSMDDPSKAMQVVPPFLQKQKPTFPIYIMKAGSEQAIVRVVDKYWEGSIPMTYVFDRTGHLQTRLVGARNLDQIEMAIRPLLARR